MIIGHSELHEYYSHFLLRIKESLLYTPEITACCDSSHITQLLFTVTWQTLGRRLPVFLDSPATESVSLPPSWAFDRPQPRFAPELQPR